MDLGGERHDEPVAVLIVFAGLPGTGKTTLARALARALRAAYLRVDEIEQAIRDAGGGEPGPAGYLAAYALARSNLGVGMTVVADCVNPLRITREAWRAVAAEAGVALREVEVMCSDPAEHRRRVEGRPIDIAGLHRVAWSEVVGRAYEAWDRPRVVVDTAGVTVAAAVRRVRDAMA